MASIVKSFWASPHFALNLKKKCHSRSGIQCLASGDSADAALSVESVKVNGIVNGVSSSVVKEKKESDRPLIEVGHDHRGSNVEEKKREKVSEEEKLEPLWDDGYGTQSVKDYLDLAKEIIRPDGGPPRWFTPISCGPPLKDSPILLFLPGMDGLGLGLILHHKSLGKVFQVQCMHIPVQDRTPFEALVQWVEETLRSEHSSAPKRPIYLVGESLGGCLALAVAARNPNIDLVVVLANPATSFGRSQLQPLLPLFEALPDELHAIVPYLLSFVMGDPVKMAAANIDSMLPLTRYFEQLSGNLTGLLPRLSDRPWAIKSIMFIEKKLRVRSKVFRVGNVVNDVVQSHTNACSGNGAHGVEDNMSYMFHIGVEDRKDLDPRDKADRRLLLNRTSNCPTGRVLSDVR